jgi:hypothetical protein
MNQSYGLAELFGNFGQFLIEQLFAPGFYI